MIDWKASVIAELLYGDVGGAELSVIAFADKPVEEGVELVVAYLGAIHKLEMSGHPLQRAKAVRNAFTDKINIPRFCCLLVC